MSKSPNHPRKGTPTPPVLPSTSLSGKRWIIVSVLLIVIGVWITYHDTLTHAFHFDDTHAIVNNEQIQDFSIFADPGYWINPNNRPLSYFTFAINYKAGGLDTKPYHLTNIAIHMVASLLLFFVLRSLFLFRRMQSNKLYPYAIPLSLVAAMIFALHPIQTQSVTYIVQRMASLAWMFALAGVLAYLHGRIQHTLEHNAKKAMVCYAITFIAYILGVYSKQSAASLPLILLAAEFLFVTNKDGKPYQRYVIAGVAGTILIAAGVILSGIIPAEKGALTPHAYFATQMMVVLKYIQLSILPLNLTLDYAFPKAQSLFELRVLIPLLIHSGFIAVAWLVRKKNPMVSFGIALFYSAMALTSTVFPIRDVIFEHRMYLSLAGFGLVASSLFFAAFQGLRKKGLYLIPAAYLLVLGWAAHERNKVWADTCTIWKDTLKKSPGNSRAWLAVGDCYKSTQDYEAAMMHYNRSLELDSTNATTLNNRGNLSLIQNNIDQAVKDYTTIIAISPESRSLALLNRGIAWMRNGEHIKAREDFSRIIREGNAETRVYFHRALTYVYLGDYLSAEKDLMVVLEKEPNHKDALFNLASGMMNTDRHAEAVNYYSQLLNFHPGHAASLHFRGVAYLTLGKRTEACADLKQAAALQYPPSAAVVQKYCNESQP